jgi:hypothetical protein
VAATVLVGVAVVVMVIVGEIGGVPAGGDTLISGGAVVAGLFGAAVGAIGGCVAVGAGVAIGCDVGAALDANVQAIVTNAKMINAVLIDNGVRMNHSPVVHMLGRRAFALFEVWQAHGLSIG